MACTLGVLGAAPSDSDSLEEYTSGLWVPLARARDDRLAEEVTAPALQWDEVLAPVADVGVPFLEEAFLCFSRAGLALAGLTAPSLSDSSLLLSKSSSFFPIWTLRAADPAFPRQGGLAPFPDDPGVTVETGLTWELFPKGFTLAGLVVRVEGAGISPLSLSDSSLLLASGFPAWAATGLAFPEVTAGVPFWDDSLAGAEVPLARGLFLEVLA